MSQNGITGDERAWLIRTARPRLTLTIVITFLFGIFGAIPAWLHGNRARELGGSAGRYWAAFAITMVVNVILYVGLLIALLALLSSTLETTAAPVPGVNSHSGNDSVPENSTTGDPTATQDAGSQVPDVGACFMVPEWFNDQTFADTDQVDCATPHNLEVVSTGEGKWEACADWEAPVSYTHLTLPTIYSV